MAPPDNFRIARITYQMFRDTRMLNNTFHLYRTAGWTYSDLVAALAAAYNVWNTYIKQITPGAIALTNIHGQVYDPHGSPWVADQAVVPGLFGTRAGTAESANVTLAVSERANLAGRAYRGRIYLPGISESDVVTNDTISAALISGVGAFAAGFLAAFPAGGANGSLVIFHRNDNLFSAVVSMVIESIIDSQRRRLPGRGR